jgi:hypothetical protein
MVLCVCLGMWTHICLIMSPPPSLSPQSLFSLVYTCFIFIKGPSILESDTPEPSLTNIPLTLFRFKQIKDF